VTYNSSVVIDGFLDSIPQGMQGIDSYELVVVDNSSSDDTVGRVENHATPARVVQTGRNAGYAGAINSGARTVDPAAHLLVLNPDVRLAPGAGAALLEVALRSHAGIVAPSLWPESTRPGTEPQRSLRRDPSLARATAETMLGGNRAARLGLGEMVADAQQYGREGWADWVTGAAMLISPECRSEVGDWDERFFLYSEETDYCLRAREAGFAVRYAPQAKAVHIGGELDSSPMLRSLLMVNKVSLYRDRHCALATLWFRLVLIVGEGMRALAGSPTACAGLVALLRNRPMPIAGRSAQPESAHPRDHHGRDQHGVILFSAQDYWYHNRAHSDVQLARALSTDRPVLLVNSLGMRMPTPGNTTQVGRRILRKLASTMRAVRTPEAAHPALHVMSLLILPMYGNAAGRWLNAALVRAQVKLAARALKLGTHPDLVITLPTAWDTARGIRARSIVVNRSDKYSALPEAEQQTIEALEADMLGACDAAVFVSHTLLEVEAHLVKRGKAIYLGHGVDVEHFTKGLSQPAPRDIAVIPRPRIGFFGGIDDYVVDLDLIERVAAENPDLSIVLIGSATCPMDRLTAQPNVHWIGMRPYEQIPAYGAAFDVALMPWLQNEWIEHCNPIKAKEYLALGLPVVTTNYPEAQYLADYMTIVDTAEDFLKAVRSAVEGDSTSDPESRRASVRNDSWQSRADVLRDLFATSGRH